MFSFSQRRILWSVRRIHNRGERCREGNHCGCVRQRDLDHRGLGSPRRGGIGQWIWTRLGLRPYLFFNYSIFAEGSGVEERTFEVFLLTVLDCRALPDGIYSLTACDHKYISCHAGLPSIRHCSPHHFYSSSLQRCVEPGLIIECTDEIQFSGELRVIQVRAVLNSFILQARAIWSSSTRHSAAPLALSSTSAASTRANTPAFLASLEKNRDSRARNRDSVSSSRRLFGNVTRIIENFS